ncbi:MAG: pseudouridine synthase [Saprospiraceae bacterium]|nr:tRNA pseudouridine(65) synthase TruC [Saprospiraceae bacterium]MCB9345821.1 pseudouridylate synthase [Lewinellaceae bacterium]
MTDHEPFSILFEDDYFVAINKPAGIMVHRTGISEDKVFVLQLLRKQLGNKRIFTTHRLDRGTSGALVFAKNQESARHLGEQFMAKTVSKKYLAMLRGWLHEPAVIDYALTDKESNKGALDAVTRYAPIANSEIEAAIGLRYPTARFSLVEAMPETGRRHQIRKHFAHINHPVIGDIRHGDVKQNKYFRNVFNFYRMMLHARSISFQHPENEQEITIEAPLGEDFIQGLELADLTFEE